MQKMLSPFELWAERIRALPRNNKLAACRVFTEGANKAVAEAEAEQRAHCAALVARGVISDAQSQGFENRLLAAKLKAREARAAEQQAKAAGADVIEKHLERLQGEGFEMVRDALVRAQQVAKVLAQVAARATHEGASPNIKLSKAQRLSADLANILKRLQ